MNKPLLAGAVAIAAIAAGVVLTSMSSARNDPPRNTADDATPKTEKQITIWRDPGCGCCDAYAEYLERNGFAVTRVDDRNFDRRSFEVGVPKQGLGCHLAEIDGYYVSGLVPADIIERLLNERPAITGITVPGMPANAPGMAWEKTGTLKTYAFGKGGISVYADE